MTNKVEVDILYTESQITKYENNKVVNPQLNSFTYLAISLMIL